MVAPARFSQALDEIRQMAPKAILSAHLPPALEDTAKLLEILAQVSASTPFVAPNQAALEQMLTPPGGGS